MKRPRDDEDVVGNRSGNVSRPISSVPAGAAGGKQSALAKGIHHLKSVPENPLVFFDIAIIDANDRGAASSKQHQAGLVGRLQIELFANLVPKTAENFRQLCTGEHEYRGLPLGYKDVPFHRVIPGMAAIGGDCLKKGGSGSISIYGTFFDDEPSTVPLSHNERGVVTMYSADKNRNGCQFMILGKPMVELDGQKVIVGRVMMGDPTSAAVLDKVLSVDSTGKKVALVVECGEM